MRIDGRLLGYPESPNQLWGLPVWKKTYHYYSCFTFPLFTISTINYHPQLFTMIYFSTGIIPLVDD